mgnify:FL=1
MRGGDRGKGQDAMTSAHSMRAVRTPKRQRRVRRRQIAAAVVASIAAGLAGCLDGPRLKPASVLVAPYAAPQAWAVAPLRNESGTSVPDGAAMADALSAELQQIQGVDVVPVNRVIQAMRTAGLDRLETPNEVLAVMNVLNVDGMIVGTITAYDPYRPMTLGLAVELHMRQPGPYGSELDPRTLSMRSSGDAAPGEYGPTNPVASAAGVYGAEDHRVLESLTLYATGRSEPDSAYGERIYLVSMEWYARFVSHQLLRSLLAQEQARLGAMVATEEATPR